MDTLTFRGKRDIWIHFVARVKQERKTVWEALEPMLQKFIKEGKTR